MSLLVLPVQIVHWFACQNVAVVISQGSNMYIECLLWIFSIFPVGYYFYKCKIAKVNQSHQVDT